MEDEGIMALPEGQATPPQELIPVSSADSYDAALIGLGNNSPQQSAAVRAAVREVISDIDLSPQELAAVLEMLEYMTQNPGEYPKLRQSLIDRDLMDPEDLPEEFDAQFLGMAIMALNEAKLSQLENAQSAEQMAPEVEGLGPLPMAEGGLADMARLLASQGRNGDTMLAHITPAEARLLKSRGGAGSYNPYTGLPEFFLKKLFKSVGKAVKKLLKNPIVRIVATVALATVLGPTGLALVSSKAAAAAIASGTVTAASGGKVKDVLISAATSYFGAGGTIPGTNINPASAIASRVGQYLPGGVEGSVAAGVGAGVTSAGIGLLAGMKPRDALTMGLQMGVTTGATQAFQNYLGNRELQEVEVTGRRMATPEAPPSGAPTTALPTEGELFAQGYTPDEIAKMPTAASTAPAAAQVAGAGGTSAVGSATQTPPGKTFTERLGQFVKEPGFGTFKDAFLVNPNETQNYLARYAPAALTTMGIGALTGGFKEQPVDQSPLYDRNFTGAEFIRKNPGMFSGNLGRVEGMPAPFNPIVPTPNYARPPVTAAPTVIPRGITRSPTGVVQPYNVAGLYGVPELAAPVEQPVYMATGGSVNNAAYQAAMAAWTRSVEDKVRELMAINPGQSYDQIYTLVTDPRRNMIPKPDPSQFTGAATSTTTPATTTPPPTRQQRIDTMLQQFMQDNPNMTADQLRPMVEQRVDTIYGQNQGYYSTGATTTPATTTPPPAGSFSGISANFGQATPPAGFNPAAPTMPERTAVRRTRAQMMAPVEPYTPRKGTPMMPRYNKPGLYGMPDLATSPPQAEVGGNTDFYNRQQFVREPDVPPTLKPPVPTLFMNQGGQPTHFPRKTGQIDGPGTGTSDSIPAMLSDGEFVFTAKAVRNAGGGSRRKGAKRMYALMKKLEGGPVKKGDA